jgi:hypothetical protein
MDNTFVYTIGKSEFEYEFDVSEIYDVKDKKEKNVSICQLNYNSKLFLIETPYLNVINKKENELHIELNDISLTALSEIDEKLCKLLEHILNNHNFSLNDNTIDLSYSTIIKNNKYIKIFIDKNTKLMSNKNKVSYDDINIGSKIQICFLLESINIYPDLNISGTKLSCQFINLYKEYKSNKVVLDDFNFTPDDTIEKPILEDQDIDYFNTIKVEKENNIIETILTEPKKRGRKPKKL